LIERLGSDQRHLDYITVGRIFKKGIISYERQIGKSISNENPHKSADSSIEDIFLWIYLDAVQQDLIVHMGAGCAARIADQRNGFTSFYAIAPLF